MQDSNIDSKYASILNTMVDLCILIIGDKYDSENQINI